MVYYKRFYKILFLVFVLLFFVFKNYGYCSIDNVTTVTPNDSDGSMTIQFDNTYLNLKSIQETTQRDLISYLYASYSEHPTETTAFVRNFYNELLSPNDDGLYFYVVKGSSGSGNKYAVFVYSWSSLSYAYSGVYTDANYTFANCTYMTGSFWGRYILENGSFNNTSSSSTLNVPFPFLRLIVPEWKQMFIDFGIITTDYQYEVLQKLDQLISDSQTTNNSISEKLEENNQLQQELNNSITDDTVNVDSSLPSSDTNDITLDGFNSIFNTLYNAFTTQNSSDVVLPIPFTGKSITINYSNVFGGFAFGVLSNIISAFWFFVISLFIAKDIKDKINKIKSGNIEDIETSNIKGDLL